MNILIIFGIMYALGMLVMSNSIPDDLPPSRMDGVVILFWPITLLIMIAFRLIGIERVTGWFDL